MESPVTFTFVCLAEKQVPAHVDVQVMAEDACRPHAWRLLREHASAQQVEIWRDEGVWDVVARDGMRASVPLESLAGTIGSLDVGPGEDAPT